MQHMLYVMHCSKWYLFYVKLETMKEREILLSLFFFSGKITGLKTLSNLSNSWYLNIDI